MSFGAILAVVIDDMHDVERLESHLVKDNRSIEILDGYEDMVEQEFTSFVSRFVLHKSSQVASQNCRKVNIRIRIVGRCAVNF